MQIFSRAPAPLVQAPSTIRVEGYPNSSPHPLEKDLAVYEYTIDQSNVHQITGELEKKKNIHYIVSSGAFCFLLFTNLIFSSSSTSLMTRAFNVVLSLGSLSTAIGTLYKHIQEKSTLEKVHLLFGSIEEQNEELLSLAKGLPSSVVTITPKQKVAR